MSEEMIAVFFDTETTGKESNSARIVQLGVLLDNGPTEVPDIIMNALCDPGIPIPLEATEVHGIRDEDIEWAPTEKIQVDLFIGYLSQLDFPVLVGHNIELYDVPVVAKVRSNILSFPTIDTYIMARRLYPEMSSHKLSDVYVELGGDMDPEGAHNAIYDCVLNHFVFQKMIEKTRYTVIEMWEYSMLPTPFIIMPFGKHKGKPMGAVPTGYLRFCRDNFTDMDIDFLATLEKYLDGGEDVIKN